MRGVQLAYTRGEEIALNRVIGAVLCRLLARDADIDRPFVLLVRPDCLFNRGVKSDMLEQAPFLCDTDEVGIDFFLARVLARPVWVGLERVRI